MKRDEFVKMAINDPKKAARVLKNQAYQLERTTGVTKVARALSKTLFITERTVFNDCKK
jgi:hypothetical protein